MNNKFVCELRTAFIPPYFPKELIGTRFEQFFKGIKKVLDYKEEFDKNNCDVYLLDNTITEKNQITEKIIQLIDEKNIELVISPNNSFGRDNKGAGDIENLIFMKEKIKKYEWFIHFEPRQLLLSYQFLDSFFKNPRNLFSVNNSSKVKHFNTGLYAAQTDHIVKFIDQFDNESLYSMVKNGTSIEYSLYDFFYKNFNFDSLEKMDLIWYDGLIERHM